ncbi:hypothetical protein CCACVL1_02507 [Corchorus capsularis]|uniref:Uncharacterized protein n=1 Tax=Corchorus capsularis TaxID=210143 RepID=A0A1R3K7Z5_COCAP|nr:hypothetical protein CCACVL1_02507 [Corchorus capsularis]
MVLISHVNPGYYRALFSTDITNPLYTLNGHNPYQKSPPLIRLHAGNVALPYQRKKA